MEAGFKSYLRAKYAGVGGPEDVCKTEEREFESPAF
jgi:hypothetical protein